MKFLIVAACIAIACAAPPPPSTYRNSDTTSIISEYSEADFDGNYKYGFKLDDGYSTDQQGAPDGTGALGIQGSYSYVDPSGNPVKSEYSNVNGIISGKYSYTDANGEEAYVVYTTAGGKYVPSGNIIPEEITNLAKNAQPYDDSEYRSAKKY